MALRRSFGFKVLALTLIVASLLAVRVGWVLSGANLSPAAEAQEDCTQVASFGPETESQTTPPFEITGNTFRLTYNTTVADPDAVGGGSLDISVLDETGQPIGAGPLVFDNASDSENILEGPGTFSLDLVADNVEYTVTVEDCGSSPTGGGGDEQYDTTTVQYEETTQVEQTIQDDRPLMDAGGPEDGPVPAMPGGQCPEEFPKAEDGACYR